MRSTCLAAVPPVNVLLSRPGLALEDTPPLYEVHCLWEISHGDAVTSFTTKPLHCQGRIFFPDHCALLRMYYAVTPSHDINCPPLSTILIIIIIT